MKMDILKDKKSKDSSRLNIHFGKIVLVLLLILGQVLTVNSNKVEASGQLYYYDVYIYGGKTYSNPSLGGNKITSQVEYTVSGRSVDDMGYTDTDGTVTLKATLDTADGLIYWYLMSIRAEEISPYGGIYHSSTIIKTYFPVEVRENGGMPVNYWTPAMSAYVSATPSKPTYIWSGSQEGTYELKVKIGEDKVLSSEYPLNGLHTDGLWYVRKGLANNDPTITVTSPSQNSYFGKINQA